MKSESKLMIMTTLALAGCMFMIAYWTMIPRQVTVEIPGEGIYSGQMLGDKYHGYGIYKSIYGEGVQYEGEWQHGYFHGQGTINFKDGSRLTGEFRYGYLYGPGQSISAEGEVRIIDIEGYKPYYFVP